MARRPLLAVPFALLALLFSSPAPAASACATAVLRDWSEDGKVGRTYAPPCYEEAIDTLPADLRDYTNAEDVITRALASAVRSGGDRADGGPEAAPGEPVTAAAGRELPVALWAAIGAAALILGAGGLAYLARRRRPGTGPG